VHGSGVIWREALESVAKRLSGMHGNRGTAPSSVATALTRAASSCPEEASLALQVRLGSSRQRP